MRKSLNKRVYKLMDYLFKYIENVDEFKHRNPNNRIIVFIYLSSYEKVEVDTWNIISDLLKKDNYMVYVPKIVGNSIIPVKYSNSFTINSAMDSCFRAIKHSHKVYTSETSFVEQSNEMFINV